MTDWNGGTAVQLAAQPGAGFGFAGWTGPSAAQGWRFVRWTGSCRGSRATCTVSMAGAARVAAVFGRR